MLALRFCQEHNIYVLVQWFSPLSGLQRSQTNLSLNGVVTRSFNMLRIEALGAGILNGVYLQLAAFDYESLLCIAAPHDFTTDIYAYFVMIFDSASSTRKDSGKCFTKRPAIIMLNANVASEDETAHD